jgi:hypothetical protein
MVTKEPAGKFCKKEVADWAFSKMRQQKSMVYIFEVSPLQALPDIECEYIVCADDRIISPTWSRWELMR